MDLHNSYQVLTVKLEIMPSVSDKTEFLYWSLLPKCSQKFDLAGINFNNLSTNNNESKS